LLPSSWYKLVQACTSLPRRYSLASRYWLAPACQGIAPCWAGTSLYPRGKELFLAKQLKAFNSLPRNNSLASLQGCTSLLMSYPLASRYRLAPACQQIASWRAGTTLYQLSKESFLSRPAQKTACRCSFTGFFSLTPLIKLISLVAVFQKS
jgi:hypothetical protein